MPIMPSEIISITPERLANLSPRYPATIVVAPLVISPDVDSSPNCAPLNPRSFFSTARRTECKPEL